MTRCVFLLLAAALILQAASPARAVDFSVKGQWMLGFGVADNALTKNIRDDSGRRQARREDDFAAQQRIFLQLDATASEQLSGSLFFHIGPQQWGKAGSGGALGADGAVVKLRNAFIDWEVPDSSLKVRMGISSLTLPNAAGGSAVFDTRTAGVILNYTFTDQISLSALWMRPFNDNFPGASYHSDDPLSYLDNMDLFGLMLPLHFENASLTPWILYGMMGRNAMKFADSMTNSLTDGYPAATLTPWLNKLEGGNGLNATNFGDTSKPYGSMFWGGLPVKITAFDPWNMELDVNYGYVEGMGRADVLRRNDPDDVVRASSRRQGWLIKALIEYNAGWGVPGIFGWYASGDDGNVKNGSERLPSLCAYGTFTSYLGDGNEHWGPSLSYFDHALSYAGTWGIGIQLRDISLLEDLRHTLRVVWWGGTNSPTMVEYMDKAYAWDSTFMRADGPYLTTHDGLLEVNAVSVWQIYDNLQANLELGYVANFMDDATWKKGFAQWGSYTKQDMWKAQVLFKYSF